MVAADRLDALETNDVPMLGKQTWVMPSFVASAKVLDKVGTAIPNSYLLTKQGPSYKDPNGQGRFKARKKPYIRQPNARKAPKKRVMNVASTSRIIIPTTIDVVVTNPTKPKKVLVVKT